VTPKVPASILQRHPRATSSSIPSRVAAGATVPPGRLPRSELAAWSSSRPVTSASICFAARGLEEGAERTLAQFAARRWRRGGDGDRWGTRGASRRAGLRGGVGAAGA
jgi:hypothetical protein